MEPLRILIVEDESIVAMDLQNRLNNFGYEVVGHVISGNEAVTNARTLEPDVILMDIQLKGEMDGIQSAKQIKSELDIPVIFLTAFADQPTLERAKLSEAFGYILKPYHERELYTNIEMAIYKHKMEKKVRENERWLTTTINNIQDGVITVDRAGNIQMLNGPVQSITGLAPEDLMGKSIDTILKKITRTTQDYFISRQGETIPLEVQETDLVDDKGTHLGKVVVLHDISERYKFEQVLRQAKETAERASAAKSEFLATISHELRTPLNSILGMTELSLEKSREDAELQENLSIIDEAGKALLAVINSILQLAQIEDNNAEVQNWKEFALQPFIDALYEKYTHEASKKNLLFRVIIHEGTPKSVIGVHSIISEILNKLLENAVKFTEQGEVLLDMFVEKDMPNKEKTWIHILVSDTGRGLPTGIKDKIFEPFMQGENIYTRSHGGTGLGLTIAKQKAEILGGEIWVESNNDRGCTFHLLLPYGKYETDIFETAYVIDNEKDEKYIEKTPSFQDYIDNAKILLEKNEMQVLEEETLAIKERFDTENITKEKEKILKILLACRRNDKKAIEDELTTIT